MCRVAQTLVTEKPCVYAEWSDEGGASKMGESLRENNWEGL